MTLVVDNRAALGTGPGLHAFIVGVSHYRHLRGGGGRPTRASFGMEQLGAGAQSALLVFDWLLAHQEDLPVPLASVRLLLSPSQEEVARDPRLPDLAQRATFRNLQREADKWRKDAATHPDNVTWFHFVGHGLQRSRDDSVILMDDFGAPSAPQLANAAATGNLINGMVPSPERKRMALKQFYFVDACRFEPPDFDNWARLDTGPVFDEPDVPTDPRQTPMFFGALPGKLAYMDAERFSLFTRAVLDCLDSVGREVGDQGGEPVFGLSATDLNMVLPAAISRLKQEIRGTDQFYHPGGSFTDALLRRFKPEVRTTICLDPDTAASTTHLELFRWLDDGEHRVLDLPAPINPHPLQCTLPPGAYRLATPRSSPGPQIGCRWVLRPPNQLMKVEVGR